MKAIRTQFDQKGFSGAVATPTCSSCCCCCCCIASYVGVSMLAVNELNKASLKEPFVQRARIVLYILVFALPVLALTVLQGVMSAIFRPVFDAVLSGYGQLVLSAALTGLPLFIAYYVLFKTIKHRYSVAMSLVFSALLILASATEVSIALGASGHLGGFHAYVMGAIILSAIFIILVTRAGYLRSKRAKDAGMFTKYQQADPGQASVPEQTSPIDNDNQGGVTRSEDRQ